MAPPREIESPPKVWGRWVPKKEHNAIESSDPMKINAILERLKLNTPPVATEKPGFSAISYPAVTASGARGAVATMPTTAPSAAEPPLSVAKSGNSAGLGATAPGAASPYSAMSWAQYNATRPTLTTEQQSAIQLDTAGRQVVALQSPQITVAAANALNTDLLSGVVGGWTDTLAWGAARQMFFQVAGSAGITAGQIVFEQTDNTALAPAGVIVAARDVSTAIPVMVSSVITITQNSLRFFEVQLSARYVRCRVWTAFAGGTVQVFATLSPPPLSHLFTALMAGTSVIGQTNVGSNTGSNTAFFDLASTSLPAGANPSSVITPLFGTFYQIVAPVTAVTGTASTMTLAVQESSDGFAAETTTVWTSPVITSIGTYKSPWIQLTGTQVRYVWTVGGTATPTFTTSLRRVMSIVAPSVRQAVGSWQTTTITTASTSQQIAAVSPQRKSFEFFNNSTSVAYLNFGANAALFTGATVPANSSYTMQTIDTNAVNAWCATAGGTISWRDAV